MSLAQRPLPNWLAKPLYGVDVDREPRSAVKTRLGWVSQSFGGQLWLNEKRLAARCTSALVGAVSDQGQLVVACRRELLQFGIDAELVELIDERYGIPAPIDAIGLAEGGGIGRVLLSVAGATYDFDVLSLAVSSYSNTGNPGEEAIAWSSMSASSASPANFDLPLAEGAISLERFILDLHSGRVLGGWGIWLLDGIAICLILLVFSGYVSWRERRKNLED